MNPFTRYMQKNIYPKNLHIKSKHFNIAFATNAMEGGLT